MALDDDDSNFKACYASLFEQVGVPRANIHTIDAEMVRRSPFVYTTTQPTTGRVSLDRGRLLRPRKRQTGGRKRARERERERERESAGGREGRRDCRKTRCG